MSDDRPYLPQRNEWRLDELDKRFAHLDEWRRRMEQEIEAKEQRLLALVEQLSVRIQSMSSAHEVAEEVARRIDGRRKLELTVAQRFLAALVVLIEPVVSAVVARHL